MKKVKGLKKFAKQFLSAVDFEEVPQAIEQLNAISSLMKKDRTFKNILTGPVFSETESQQIIDLIGQKLMMSDKTIKYIRYLSESKAIVAMPEIVSAIESAYLEMKKKAKAIVTSPIQISKDYEAKLRSALKEITGRDIDIELTVDSSLLGGVRIKIGSTMYDSSIKGQLELLRDKLMK